MFLSLIFYVRSYLRLSRNLRQGEPIIDSGWITSASDTDYEELYHQSQNDSFGLFCQRGIYALIVIAFAYGIDVKHDVFAFLIDLK